MITSVSFSPDSKWVVTGSDDKTATIWNAITGQPMRKFNGHSAEVVAASFSPDGGRIVTSGRDGTARVWEVMSGRELARWTDTSGPIPGTRGLGFRASVGSTLG